MDPSGPSEYDVAFFIGLTVIWLFAWRQFSRPSFERYRQFDEILQLLRPQDLRSAGVFFPAYMFYALILSAVYWVLCEFGSLQLLSILGIPGLGIDSPGTSVGALLPSSWSDPSVLVELASDNSLTTEVTRVFQGDRDVQRNPTVPLTIALALVGVVPNVPLFVKFEEKLRVVAHTLAGIPARLFDGTRYLVDSDLSDLTGGEGVRDDGPSGLAAARTTLERLKARQVILDKEKAFAEKILFKVFFFRELLRGERAEISWPSYSVQSVYQPVSDKILPRIDALEGALSKLRPAGGGADAAESPPEPEKMQELRVAWKDSLDKARQLEVDICVLLMVYAEKDGLPGDRSPASGRLRRFIASAHEASAHATVSFNIFANVLVTIVLVSFVYAILYAFDPAVNDARDLNLIVQTVVMSLMTYMFATIIALTYRQITVETTWASIYEQHWIKGVVQLIVVFALATLVSFLSLCVWNIYTAVQTTGNIIVVERWENVVAHAMAQEWSRAIQGGLFAVFIVLGMDFWDTTQGGEAKGADAKQVGLGPALLGGLVLGIWGAATIIVIARQNGATVDDLRMIKAGGLAFVIGAASGAVVQATLRSIQIGARRKAAAPQETPAGAAPPAGGPA